jgi:endo-1,3(4)-beta-glucanase
MFDVAHSSHASSEEVYATDGAFFPLARHKSWYDSHSFASGLFPSASGKSMESSSESVNCYYGAYLWSTVRGKSDSSLKDDEQLNFARLLLAMEIRGVKTYWHMSPQNTGDGNNDLRLYNPTFAKNFMVGNLGMSDATVSTWFGSNPIYVHMINFMPITGITRELFDTAYLKKEFTGAIEPIYDNVEMAW